MIDPFRASPSRPAMRRRRVAVTKSLASTNGVPVHSKYRRQRKPLLPVRRALAGVGALQSKA